MLDAVLARRYAAALYGAAEKRGLVDAIDQDMTAISLLQRENRQLRNFLHSPRVLPSRKVEMVRKVCGDRVQPLTVNFLLLLLDKKRFDYLHEICDAFNALADERRGIVHAKVRGAAPLSDEQVGRLKSRIEARTGKQVKLEVEVDPELLGGVSVVVGDHLIDGSVRRALGDLRDRLLATNVL